MRSVVVDKSSEHKQPLVEAMTARFDTLTWGLAGASVVGQIGGMVSGYPMLNMMQYSDNLMYMSLMGVGLAVLAAISIMIVVGMKRSDPEDIEFQDRRKKHHRRKRY
eukprot:Gregarina_sp_Pseudo_9__1525@NODE_2024_length_1197_cov_26_098446_g1869_i0_p2_GENE_NODE_2024_length_1197_cov_26_098446_g1869_i0NODE_2024_length_1197_cov_26_098446_g1869_i0_p2_ORF_typecomplete_len107_score15_29TLC/PF03219_14/0_0064MFS_2/PF13347_6/0_019DUF4079/PF13301_6/0_056_NODE_2024_length_1197_cov_26_098446_g1869_i026346